MGEIRLACHGAQASEFGDFYANREVAPGFRVVKCVEIF